MSCLIRLVSCLNPLRDYVAHEAYIFIILIAYYILLSLYHYLLEGFYRTSFRDITKIKFLSLKREKDLDNSNRNIKLGMYKHTVYFLRAAGDEYMVYIALQRISGSLSKFESSIHFSNKGKIKRKSNKESFGNESMPIILRNIQHITLILDDIVVLEKLEDSPFPKATSGSIDLSSVLHEMIRSLEDATVPRLMSHVIFNDVQTRSPIISCSTSMLNIIIGNIILHAMTAIRRRSLRQRVGYKPYLNVVCYVVEDFSNDRNTTLHQNDRILRLVFDHNGDFASIDFNKTPETRNPNTNSTIMNFLHCIRAPNESYSSNENKLFDGTEIFQVQLLSGARPSHNVASRGSVYTIEPVNISSSKEAHCVNEDKLRLNKLSALTIVTADAVTKDCGGKMTLEDFIVSNDAEGSGGLPFSRVIVDIPCSDSAQQKPLFRNGRYRKKKAPSTLYPDDNKKHSLIKIYLIIFDKEVLSSLLVILKDMNVSGDILRISKSEFSSDQLNGPAIIKSKYTAVFFDIEAVGTALRDVGYFGERVFFTPNSLLEGNIRSSNFEHVMPIPCTPFVVRQFLVPRLTKSLSISDKNKISGVIPTNSEEYGVKYHIIDYAFQLQYWLHSFHVLVFLSRMSYRLFACLLWVLKASKLALKWFFFEPLQAPLLNISNFSSFFSSCEVIGNGNANFRKNDIADNSADLPNFGSQFSFIGTFFAIPYFSSEVEQEYITWRVYNTDNGALSHSMTLLLTFVIQLCVGVLTSRYSADATGSLSVGFDTRYRSISGGIIIFALIVILIRIFIRKKLLQYYSLFAVHILFVALAIVNLINSARELFDQELYSDRINKTSEIGVLLIHSIAVLPIHSVVFPFATMFWGSFLVVISIWTLKTYIVVYALLDRGYAHRMLVYVLFVCISMAFFVCTLRMFELEYFRRVEYQVHVPYYVLSIRWIICCIMS